MLIDLLMLLAIFFILYYVGQKVESKKWKIALRIFGYLLLVLVLYRFYGEWIVEHDVLDRGMVEEDLIIEESDNF